MPEGYHSYRKLQIKGSPSRPLTPAQQFSLLEKHEQWSAKVAGRPTDKDLKRYQYYLTRGIINDDLEPMEDQQMHKFYCRIPTKLALNPDLSALREKLENEIHDDYQNSLRKAIVDYILMDPQEKQRLRINSVPRYFHKRY